MAEGLLVGVARAVDENRDGRVLKATPVEHLLDESGLQDYFHEAGLSRPALRDVPPGSLEAIREYARSLHDRAHGDAALPLDFETDVSIASTLRFSPRNPRVPFLGRLQEFGKLDEFLDASRPFTWWLITGGGGAGKTRLARQFCLHAHSRGWRAGFLPNGFKADDIASLDAWCPQRPTLIVADYVLKEPRTTEIRKLAARLARRTDLAPVRLLLLEREGGESFRRGFLGSDQSDRAVIEAARYHSDSLTLPELSEDDIWSLVALCPWRADAKRLTILREMFLARLRSLDRQRRPLVAMILADALATTPERGDVGGLEGELRDLLRRDREHLWPQELGVSGREIGDTEADVAIAFATMVGGLGLPELNAIDNACGRPLSRSILPACAKAVGKPIPDPPRLGSLEPDLIGEFFCLETLRGSNPVVDPPHSWMPETAWRVRGGGMADFVTRARQNFPIHPSVERVAITVRGVEESWLLAALSMTADGTNELLSKAREMLLAPARSDIGATNAFARLTLLASLLETGVLEREIAATYLDALATLPALHPDEPALRARWAESVTNFIAHRAAENPAGCQALLETLAKLHAAHPDEPTLRAQWAQTVTNFVAQSAAKDPTVCQALLEALND